MWHNITNHPAHQQQPGQDSGASEKKPEDTPKTEGKKDKENGDKEDPKQTSPGSGSK